MLRLCIATQIWWIFGGKISILHIPDKQQIIPSAFLYPISDINHRARRDLGGRFTFQQNFNKRHTPDICLSSFPCRVYTGKTACVRKPNLTSFTENLDRVVDQFAWKIFSQRRVVTFDILFNYRQLLPFYVPQRTQNNKIRTCGLVKCILSSIQHFLCTHSFSVDL